MAQESRQVRRARERAEAKQKNKQNNLGYIPNNIAGFKPDAGINSKSNITNHYWFQVSEFASNLLREHSVKGYDIKNNSFIELQLPVDIMDKDGDKHSITHPSDGKGFCLTMRFSHQQMNLLADQIDKGGMSVRVSGKPAEIQTSPNGEKFQIVDCEDIYSEGNHSGSMLFMLVSDRGVINVNSQKIAQSVKAIVSSHKFQKQKEEAAQ